MPPLFNIFHQNSSSSSSLTMSGSTEKLVQEEERQEPANTTQTTSFDAKWKRKKQVSFYDRVVAYEYINLEQFSEEEHAQSWYSRPELHQIHHENEETVQRMMAGACNGMQWCPRGLESRTPTGGRLRYKHRHDAMEAVMEYQSLENESGVVHDHERIAKTYSDHTEHCTRVALLMATIDAQAVQGDKDMQSPLATIGSPTTPNRCLRRVNSTSTPSPVAVRAV